MFIDCPGCARSYHIKDADIGSAGRKVVCPRCETNWFVDGSTLPVRPSRDLQAVAVSTRTAPLTIEAKPVSRIRPRAALRRLSLPGAMAASVLLGMGLLGARETIVRQAPRTASLYNALGLSTNVRGLEIVASAQREADDSDVRVSGTIRNVVPRRVPMPPRLVYDVRDARGAPLTSWTERAPARSLATGRSLVFISSPHKLPPESSSVIVRFESGDQAPRAPAPQVNAFN